MNYTLLVVVPLLVALFGVAMAQFALRHEQLEGKQPKELPGKPSDPYALVWWQDLQDLGFEFHLANGETWRGRLGDSYHRYPDGADESHTVPMEHWDKLASYRRRIEWKEPEIWALHAHTLVDWSALDRAYQLKLLNGSVWQFNTKSEGLSENNELAWHRISSPKGIVFEDRNSVYAALNKHLAQIRKDQERARLMQNDPLNQHLHLNAALMAQAQGTGLLSGALHSNTCGQCGLAVVSIPGGICRHCREAAGHGA